MLVKSAEQPTPLLNLKPISIISDTKPSTKDRTFFFKLSNYTDYQKWMKRESVQSEIQNKLEEWLKDGLADWI